MKDKKEKDPLTLLEMQEATEKRVSAIAKEFKDGFDFLSNYPRSVTFFGSTHTKPDEEYYKKAEELAKKIVKETRYSILTGGGPGVMEAANKGAFEAGGNSLGLTIDLPRGQITNKFLTDMVSFHYFFSRKVCLSYSAEAYLFFPGGFGTLDEFTEILTLVQTSKIPKVPLILVGKKHWQPLLEFFKDPLFKRNMVDKEDLDLFTIIDDDKEILEIIKRAPLQIGVRYKGSYSHDGEERLEDKPLTERPLSSLSPLLDRHCEACEKDSPPLTREQSLNMNKEVPSWTLIEDKELEKTYELGSWNEAVDFVNKISEIANEEGHHPDVSIHDFRKVTIRLWTHAISGLSENDFIMAAKIDYMVNSRNKIYQI